MTHSTWQPFDYQLKFHFGEFVLARVNLPVHRRVFTLDEIKAGVSAHDLPPLSVEQQGFLLSNMPIAGDEPTSIVPANWLIHRLKTYQRCYIDMSGDFETYKAKFSSKSRSGINRKIKKFAEESGGLDMRIYRQPEELETFFSLAGKVSEASYQERLLDCGLPRSASAIETAKSAAAHDDIRAFLLFSHGRPVSYLYCPIENGVLMYAYLGYIPELARLSPGTVLQWLALETLFAEQRFRAFDFTEGDSDHKRFFSTHQIRCRQELRLRPSLRNRCLMMLYGRLIKLSDTTVETLDRFGLKQRIKRWIRRTA